MRRRQFLTGLGAITVAGGLAGCGGQRPELVPAPAGSDPSTAGSAATDPGLDPPDQITFPPRLVEAGPAGDKVALTFHLDGDPALVNGLLDALAERQTPVTIFIIGQWLESHPGVAERLLDGGHDLGNHTFSHGDMVDLPREAMLEEINRCAAVMESMLGTRGRWFRPSAIDVPTQAMVDQASAAGYEATIGFNVDPLDYQDPGAAAIVSATLGNIKGGDIVSLHFGHLGTNQAMPEILDGIDAMGLTASTVSSLLDP